MSTIICDLSTYTQSQRGSRRPAYLWGNRETLRFVYWCIQVHTEWFQLCKLENYLPVYHQNITCLTRMKQNIWFVQRFGAQREVASRTADWVYITSTYFCPRPECSYPSQPKQIGSMVPFSNVCKTSQRQTPLTPLMFPSIITYVICFTMTTHNYSYNVFILYISRLLYYY